METKIIIRNVAITDLERIFQIEENLFAPMHYPLFVLRQLYEIASNLFFVAVDQENNIKGYCFGGLDNNTKTGWIFALAVTKPNQRKQLGQRLTVELLNTFKSKKINTVQLTTTPDNVAAKYLYKKLGFQKVKTDSNYYLDDSPRIVMKLVFD